MTWYFLHGECRFQRSTHGAMVERLIRDSMGSARCRICGGVGILEDEKAVLRHRSIATTEKRERWTVVEERKRVDCGVNYRDGGPTVIEEMVQEWHAVGIGSECQRCRGTGWVSRRRPARECEHCKRLETRTELPDGKVVVEREPIMKWRDRRRLCSECGGTGVASATVQRTCADHDGGGSEVNGDVLRNYALTNRRLRPLGHHRITLELYYGAHGQSWADQPGGRMLALQVHTQAGKRLLEKTKTKDDDATEAGPDEKFAAQIALQQTSPTPWRRKLLQEAAEQASRAYQEAIQAWIEVTMTVDPRSLEERTEDVLEAIDDTGVAYEEWLDRNPDCWEIPPFVGEEGTPGGFGGEKRGPRLCEEVI